MKALQQAAQKFGIRYWKISADGSRIETIVQLNPFIHAKSGQTDVWGSPVITHGDFDLIGFLRDECGLKMSSAAILPQGDNRTLYRFTLRYGPDPLPFAVGARVRVSCPDYPKYHGQRGAVAGQRGDYTLVEFDNGLREDFHHTELWAEDTAIFDNARTAK